MTSLRLPRLGPTAQVSPLPDSGGSGGPVDPCGAPDTACAEQPTGAVMPPRLDWSLAVHRPAPRGPERIVATAPRAFEIVLAHIEDSILAGTYRVGDTLPAERQLAEQLGVSRAAVREAIRALEAQGVLSSSVGAGTTGGTKVTHARGRALTRLLRLHVHLSDAPVDEVVELRVSLERTSARLVATAADEDVVVDLRAAVEAMEDPGLDLAEFNELDTRFHVAIARLARNDLVTDLTTAVREALRGPILDAERRLEGTGAFDEFRATLLAGHRALYEAIAAHDGAAAADLVEQHIRSAYAILPDMQLGTGEH